MSQTTKSLFLSVLLLSSSVSLAQKQSAADSLRSLVREASDDTTKVFYYLKLHDELRLSNFNEAATVARESFALAKEIDWRKGIALTGRNFGIALNLLGKYDSAELILQHAVKSSQEVGDTSNIAYCYMTMGNIQYDQTNYDDALEYYFKCLETYKSIDNYAGMSSALIWVGIIYQYAKSDYQSAIETYREALKYCELGNSTLNKGYIYSNLATIYNNRAINDSALQYYRYAHEIKRQFGDQRGIGNDYNNMGNVWYDMKNYDSALFNYERSLEIRREMNDQTGIASALINMGKVYMDLELWSKAEVLLEQGYAVAKSVNYQEALQQAALFLSIISEEEKDWKSALSRYKEYKIVSDSIFNYASDQSISELQTKYQTQQKEQQIQLQESILAEQEAELRVNRILLIFAILLAVLLIVIGILHRSRSRKKHAMKLQEAQILAKEAEIHATISSQEKERSRYARDLHDGFGQMISILNMNLKNLESGANPDERQQVYEESAKVIDGMYEELKNICFDLMPQTLIKEGLAAALSEFIERVNKAGKIFIELNVFGLDERLSEIQEISLYRISQEWINNILKYSDAEKVTLQITKDEDEITLLIEDNGAGFDKSLLLAGKGNGWKNLNTRAKLISGDLELETKEGKKGSTLIVNAPASLHKRMVPVEQNTIQAV